MGSSDTSRLFPGQDGAVLTWDGVHAFLLQLREVLQEELEGVICGDALEFEPVHVGLWGQMGLMPDTDPSSAAQPSVCSTSLGKPIPAPVPYRVCPALCIPRDIPQHSQHLLLARG